MLIFPLAIALAPLFAPFIIGWIFEGFFKQWMAFLFLGFFAIILSGVFLSAFGQLASALNVADFAIIVLHEPAAGSSMPGVEFVWINILSFFLYSIILLFLSRLIWTIASGLSGGFSLSSGMNVNLPSRRKQ
jgi:small-conductance mechanosensitive channel